MLGDDNEEDNEVSDDDNEDNKDNKDNKDDNDDDIFDNNNNDNNDNDDNDNSSLSSVLFSKMKFHINGSAILQNDCCLFWVHSIMGGCDQSPIPTHPLLNFIERLLGFIPNSHDIELPSITARRCCPIDDSIDVDLFLF